MLGCHLSAFLSIGQHLAAAFMVSDHVSQRCFMALQRTAGTWRTPAGSLCSSCSACGQCLLPLSWILLGLLPDAGVPTFQGAQRCALPCGPPAGPGAVARTRAPGTQGLSVGLVWTNLGLGYPGALRGSLSPERLPKTRRKFLFTRLDRKSKSCSLIENKELMVIINTSLAQDVRWNPLFFTFINVVQLHSTYCPECSYHPDFTDEKRKHREDQAQSQQQVLWLDVHLGSVPLEPGLVIKG